MKLTIDLWQWAQASRSMVWDFQANDLQRFSSACLDVIQPIKAELKTGFVDPETVRVSGAVHAVVLLQCQTCLSPVQIELKESYSYDIKRQKKESKRPCLEIAEDGQLNVIDLIEDELLLSIPTFPRHEKVCNHLIQEAEQKAAEARNPFSVLNKLKVH